MLDQDIIAVFKTHRPKSVVEMRNLGLNPTHVGGGSCRDFFKLTETIGVKVERRAEYYQTKAEVNAIMRINRDPSFEQLRKHTPPLLYADQDNGIIVTPYYDGIVQYGGTMQEKQQRTNLYSQFAQAGVHDLFEMNLRKAADGTLMVIDLGCYNSPRPEND